MYAPSTSESFVLNVKHFELTFFNLFLDVLNIHLVDVVSGGIVTTITHRRVRGPVNMIHSENWLVYSYYNDKVRRTELSKFWE